MCLSIMIVICIKQHLSNTEAELKKKALFIKKIVYSLQLVFFQYPTYYENYEKKPIQEIY